MIAIFSAGTFITSG